MGSCLGGILSSEKLSGGIMSEWDCVLVGKCHCGNLSVWEIVEWEIDEWETVRVGSCRLGNCQVGNCRLGNCRVGN